MKNSLHLLFILFLMFAFSVQSQIISVSGEVTDSKNGQPLAGVAVRIKGTSIGTVTNSDGIYKLNVPSDAHSLLFSFVGKKTIEKTIDQQIINVSLETDILGVDEVMVVAYGTTEKEHFTGAASTVSSQRLERFQTAGFTKNIQGIASGIWSNSGLGQPGEEADIRIRGLSTFSEAGPLIVLDGFPFDGPLNSIPNADIASLTILKDASATALYGSRAANGVILINTKQGKPGTGQIHFGVRYGFSGKAMPDYRQLTRSEYYELQWEGLKNRLISGGISPEEAGIQASQQIIQRLGGYNAYDVPNDQVVGPDGKFNQGAQPLWDDNWNDELLETEERKEIVFNVQGGNERTRFFLSGNLLDAGGIVKASDFKRYSVRASVNHRFNRRIRLGANLGGSLSEQNFPVSSGTSYLNPFFFVREVAPIYPVYLYDQEGQLQTDSEGNKLYDYGTAFGRARMVASNVNPLGTIKLDQRLYRNDVFNLRSYAEFLLIDGLSFKTSFAADYTNQSGINHENRQFGSGQNFGGKTHRLANRTFSYTANQMLTFQRTFGEHQLNLLVGHENYQYQYNNLNAERSGFPFPGLVELDAAATSEGSGSYEDNYRLESYLARADYVFRDRYFFSINVRRDGNSRFGEAVRWGNFWGGGAAWMISRESFLQDRDWLNTLRLKLSYGEQGNDQIGSYYAYQGLYQTGINNLNYPGMLASRLSTPDLTWESLKSTNIGAEMKFLDRFAIQFDYFIRKNDDLLFEKPLPPSTGFSSVDANIARVSNTGFDLEMSGILLDTDALMWNLDVTLSHFNNQIEKLPQEFIIQGDHRWEVGKSIYDFWIEDYAGVDPETGQALWVKKVMETDEQGNLVFSGETETTANYAEADRFFMGSAIPDLLGGVTNSLGFFNFDLSVFLNFSIGNDVLDKSYQRMMHSGTYGIAMHQDAMNRWTPENTETDVPVLNGDPEVNFTSSRFLVDGSYLNLKNITFGYQVPQNLVSSLKLASARLFLTGENLGLLTSRQGLNPLESLDGTNADQYYMMRTVSMGVDIRL